MASKELGVKFSNEIYATKKDVANYMKTPMIDNIWNTVLEYRENFVIRLKLKHITASEYSVCLTPTINERINGVERKLMNIYFRYLKLSLNKSDIFYKKSAYEEILKGFASNYNLNIEDYEIQKILALDSSNLKPELLIVYNYYLALESISKLAYEDISRKTFENFNNVMLGLESSEYRKNEVQNDFAKVLVNRIYVGLPPATISKSMDNLVEFLNDTQVGMFTKAICAMYFIYYVRPFDAYCEDLAVYAAKAILAHEGLEEVASSLHLELLLNDKEEFKKYFIESQKTQDLTYLIDFAIKKMEKVIEEANLNLNNSQGKAITNELYANEVKSNDLVPNLDELEEAHDQMNNSPKIVEEKANVSFTTKIAIENIPTGLDEKEAMNLEKRLLEMEPNLSRGQAYFYARHCTLNMNYTISQYKKEVGCAYETARSSMDNLVRLGYYKKELLKNKFVYIPIKRR